MNNEKLYPCQKMTTRDAYEVDKPEQKTLTDYAEEICAVLDDPIGVAEGVIGRVKGARSIPVEEQSANKACGTLDLLRQTLEKAQKLRQLLYELNGCV